MPDIRPRRAHRYQVVTPVLYWWASSGGPVHAGSGQTRNISQSGVLVAANECPPAGASIQMTLGLPRLPGNGQGMKLHGEGVVVRVHDADVVSDCKPARVFAASVLFYPDRSERSEQPDPIGIEEFSSNLQ